MNNYIAWIIVGVAVVGGLILYGVSAPTERTFWGQRSAMMSTIDQHFIEEMIPHHEGAIVMAKLALERSTRPEILSLSQGIIEAQTKEINDMQKWYKEWFGVEVPVDSSMMGMGHGAMGAMQGMEGDIEKLKVAEDFDKEFLSQMIVHHEMAVMMGRMLLSGTSRAEMKTLADNIITSQTREIEMMRSWLNAW